MTDHLPSKDVMHPSLVPALRRAAARGDQLSGAAADAIDRLHTALRGIQSCSTCSACRGAASMALGGEAAAARKPDKFDLAFEIMRQLEAEDMETMQSCQFGYVMRVTRERAAKPPGDDPADVIMSRGDGG